MKRHSVRNNIIKMLIVFMCAITTTLNINQSVISHIHATARLFLKSFEMNQNSDPSTPEHAPAATLIPYPQSCPAAISLIT